MKINRVFIINKNKLNLSLFIKKIVLLFLKTFDVFITIFKNLFIIQKNTLLSSKYIYFIDKEKIKDYEINISKIVEVYKSGKFIQPINKSSYFCDALQIDISDGSEIFNLSKFSANFDLYVKSRKLKKIKNYSFNFHNEDFKNIIKTKKWLTVKIKLNKSINLKNKKILIKFKELEINKNKRNNQKYLSCSLTNFKKPKHQNVIFIVLDGITNSDLRNYINNFSTKHIFNKLLQDSVYFKNSITGSVVTGSSLPSLLTNSNLFQHGLYKYESHLKKNSQFPSKKLKFLSEEFLDNGYFTQALTNFSRMRPHFGMNIGFMDYTNICTNNFHTSVYFEKMHELIEVSENNKTFSFFHFIGGHPPFHPKINYNHKNTFNDNERYFYYSNIEKSELFLEAIINKLKQKNLYKNTTLIITSDHGRTLKRFNKANNNFFESRLSVPLIYKPRQTSFPKFKSKIINNRVNNVNEIYNLLNKYEKIKLNNNFEVKNNFLWTTITSTYDDLNSFIVIGYDNSYKWVFKCVLNENNGLKIEIIGQPLAFKIIKTSIVDEERNLYNQVEENKKKKVKKSLFDFIKQSKNNSFKTERQNENLFHI